MSLAPKHAILAGTLACFLLAFVCAKIHLPAIEQDLIARTQVALNGIPIEHLRISANGREIILNGAASELAIARAGLVASNIFGVFRVRNRLRVLEAAALPQYLRPPADP